MESLSFDFFVCTEVAVMGTPAGKPEDSKATRTDKLLTNKKKSGNRLLMVGRLLELALYRAEVLRQKGFSVRTVGDVEEAIGIIQQGGFDAIILSYTLSSDVVQFLTEAAREHCPDCPVIAIGYSSMLDGRIAPDAIAIADEGPTALLAAIRRVLQPEI